MNAVRHRRVDAGRRHVVAGVLACVAFVQPVRADEVALPALRAELLTRAEVDQALRLDLDPMSSKIDETKWRRIRIVDAANTRRMHEVIDRSGWPTRAQVGNDGSKAAWLLVQHASADPAFQRRCLGLMQALGRDEVPGESIALLTDRVRLAAHEKQLYGSQVQGDCTTGYKPFPIEDEAHLDERRARLDLPPMADYLQFMSSAFCSTKSP